MPLQIRRSNRGCEPSGSECAACTGAAPRHADAARLPIAFTVAAAIMGVGAAKRFGALKWTIVERMVWAWMLTIPVSATIAFWLVRIAQAVGFEK